ncbi:MAG: YdeI/OmpD-associated family protein [Gemmatimonadota bacterium]
MLPIFFASPSAWAKWLAAHHDTETELLVGFYKKGSGQPSITWPESVDEALAYGWIDGVRRSLDETSYTIRFSPRRPRSKWSAVNVKRIGELIKLGKVRPAGLRAFEQRVARGTETYSYEQRHTISLPPAYQRKLRADPEAWKFFGTQPPGYQKIVTWWVMSAKKDETRLRRLAQLIADSASGRRVGVVTLKPKAS